MRLYLCRIVLVLRSRNGAADGWDGVMVFDGWRLSESDGHLSEKPVYKYIYK